MITEITIDGKKLLQLRSDLGWSRKYLGDKLGVHESAISRWEDGSFTPKTKHIETLLSILGDDAKDLFRYHAKVSPVEKLLTSRNIRIQSSSVNNSFNNSAKYQCSELIEDIEADILTLNKCDKETIFNILNIIKKHKNKHKK